MQLAEDFTSRIALLIVSAWFMSFAMPAAFAHGAASNISSASADAQHLIEVASSPRHQWNGIAVATDGRLFASFPRWLRDDTISVGEILKDGTIRHYHGGDWNTWSPDHSPENPNRRFVSVNAVHIDAQNNLWVVDPATPRMGSMVPNGPKLVRIDLATNQVARVYRFDERVLPAGSSLNDVRIYGGHAYLTESGQGAIIVLNLETGAARRLLADHPSVNGDPEIIPVVEGDKMLDPQGHPVRFNANDIEVTPDGSFLLYQPANGPTWSRVPIAALLDPNLSAAQLGARVEQGFETMPLGGTTMDRAGNIYLMDVERRAIWRQDPNGKLKLIVRDPRLLWPDASDIGPDGYLYVPAAQVHRVPMQNGGENETERPFKLFKIRIKYPSENASTR